MFVFDKKQFIEDLKKHEGVVLKIYPDPIHGAAAPTCGVGHLLVPGDPHYGKPIGTVITEEDMLTYLEKDVATALSNAAKLYPDFSSLPGEAQQIIADMIFNLGYAGWVEVIHWVLKDFMFSVAGSLSLRR